MTYATEPTCPKCSGPLWDNRATKRNPKQPDFKCKDKACEGVIWPPKNGAPAPATTAKQGYTAGGHIPAIDGPYTETGAPPSAHYSAPVPAQHAAVDRLSGLFTLYGVCMDEVLAAQVPKLNKADVGTTPEAIAAMAATLFIAASKS